MAVRKVPLQPYERADRDGDWVIVDVSMGSIAQGDVAIDRLALDRVTIEVLGIDGCPSVNMH